MKLKDIHYWSIYRKTNWKIIKPFLNYKFKILRIHSYKKQIIYNIKIKDSFCFQFCCLLYVKQNPTLTYTDLDKLVWINLVCP